MQAEPYAGDNADLPELLKNIDRGAAILRAVDRLLAGPDLTARLIGGLTEIRVRAAAITGEAR